jgi:transcriptional regulator with XRE-family HTH domain
MNIGEKIRAARLAKGMTQEELGEILGVQKSAVAKYESGRIVNIKRSNLKKISDVLGIRPSELIHEKI